MSEVKTSVVSAAQDLVNEARKKQNAFLVVQSARSAALVGRMFKLDRPEMVVGRSVDAQIHLDDEGISRRHAKIVNTSGSFQVMDLGSTNGTFLNASRVEVAPLADGDRIQIGKNTVLKFSVQDQLEEQYQRSIYENATRDGLTRVFNRKYFMDALRKEFAYGLRHRVPLAVAMIDVDHFKKLNDTYGHPAGDHVLARLAQKIAETIRSEDLLARYGGEEFVILMRESRAEQAMQCAERCRRAIESADFTFNGMPIRASISVGVATSLDSDLSQPDDLIATADRFLYEAKRKGRNRVEGNGKRA